MLKKVRKPLELSQSTITPRVGSSPSKTNSKATKSIINKYSQSLIRNNSSYNNYVKKWLKPKSTIKMDV